MKKFVLALICLASVAIGAHAQLLWKVSGNDLQKPSFLFGTHHLAPISMMDSVAGFADAFAAADAVAGEVAMSSMSDPEMTQTIMMMSMAPADSTLMAVLSPMQVDSVNQVLKGYTNGQLSVEMLGMTKPAMVSNQLSVLVAMEALGPDRLKDLLEGRQLDTQVQIMATEAGKEVLAFETVAEQLNLLMGAPIAEQASDLMETIAKINDGSAQKASKDLTDAYIAQDLDNLTKVMFDPEVITEQEMKHLITDRNAGWVTNLLKWMPEKSVFVAVGAGHLPGEEGLISRLRNAGYDVTPVTE